MALGLAATLAGCGGSNGDTGGASGAGGGDIVRDFDYPLDDVLRLNHLQAKGTHNSYHVEKEGNDIDAWRYTHAPLDVQVRSLGVRAVELDTRFDWSTEAFEVWHLPVVDDESTCRRFADCLAALESWSSSFPAHHPLLVQIEPKDVPPAGSEEDYFARLEGEILSVFPRERIVTPDDVLGDAPTLREAIASRGWPTLGSVRGKVLFFVDDTGDFRRAYTRDERDLAGRLMFVDGKFEDPKGFDAVFVLNDPVSDADEIAEALAAGFLVRTRADADGVEPQAGDTTRRDAAIASGAHIVSTDFPAPVEGRSYSVELPGGTPSRCNPVTAPAECTSEAVEDPAFAP